MHLQLGFRPVLVIASSDLAKECFTTNDKAFASRPLQSFKLRSLWLLLANLKKNLQAPALYCGQNRILQARPHRGNFRSHSFAVPEFAAKPQSSEHQVEALRSHINITVRIVVSKRFSPDLCSEDFKEAQQFKELIEETFLLAGSFDIGYYLPFLKWIDPHGIVFAMKNLHEKRDVFMKKFLHDHREKRGVHARDLIDVLISAVDNHEIHSDNNDDVVKAIALSMINAGTETSASTIEWALSALMKHPNILGKAHKELDTHVGRDRLIEESVSTS